MSVEISSLPFDLASLRKAYASGIDPQDLVREVYRRIAAYNDPGIFIHLRDEAEVIADAARLGSYDPSKPLWGAPFAIKDNIDFAGVPTSAACPDFAFVPQQHSMSVKRLVDAGALAIGKTNLDQFATGLVGVRTPFPAPRNSFDEKIVPGGSSSGSAVAVASGLTSFSLGTDTAGSGRVPAGLNNLVGLKPSLGAISTTGVVPACRSLDCVSVFALTVADAHCVFEALCAYDPLDPFSRLANKPLMILPPPSLRVGIPDARSRRFGGDRPSEDSFDTAVSIIRDLGYAIVEIDLEPFFEAARLLYEGPWVAERYAAIRGFIEAQPEALHPVTRNIISGALRFSASDAFIAQYRLRELRRIADQAWRNIDVLVTPTYPRPRSVADLQADPIGPNSELGTYTNFVNLLDQCALAVPSGFRADGFPGSMTLIAPAGRDGLLAGLGMRIHQQSGVTLGAIGWPLPKEAGRETGGICRAGGDEIELVLVGAHLSGMALNHELTGAGGRFLRVAKTVADYRLYALPGGPPFKPGLLRGGAGVGFEIDVEVWAMSIAEFGRFVAAIPSPLGLAKIRLQDGTSPSGFIAEAAGIAGAEDISQYLGWRAYMAARTG